MSKTVLRYLFRVLIAIDQLANTIIGGYPDESISARSFRCRKKYMRWKIARIIIDGIFIWQYDGKQFHCEQCYWYERDRKDMPPEYWEV